MRSAAFVLLLLGACNSASSDDDVQPLDAPGVQDDPCNARDNVGCEAGDKCTWVWIDTEGSIGITACVPDQTVGEGGACVWARTAR